MNEALGLLEVVGYVRAVETADIMLKAADVSLNEIKVTRGIGWTTVTITGNVAAVKAAIQAGEQVAKQKNALICAHVIPRPIHPIFPVKKQDKEKIKSISEIKPTTTQDTVKETKPSITQSTAIKSVTAEQTVPTKDALKIRPKAVQKKKQATRNKPTAKTTSTHLSTKKVTKSSAKSKEEQTHE